MIGKNFKRGTFIPLNPEKYLGNLDNITFRSSWEQHLMIFFDTNPSVVAWSSEEVVIPYFSKVDKRPRRYFVDFFARYVDKNGNIIEEIIEVKPAVETQPPIKKRGKRQSAYLRELATFQVNVDKWTAASEYAKKRGWKFRILTEENIFGRT